MIRVKLGKIEDNGSVSMCLMQAYEGYGEDKEGNPTSHGVFTKTQGPFSSTRKTITHTVNKEEAAVAIIEGEFKKYIKDDWVVLEEFTGPTSEEMVKAYILENQEK